VLDACIFRATTHLHTFTKKRVMIQHAKQHQGIFAFAAKKVLG
jgi:hypothetical protein